MLPTVSQMPVPTRLILASAARSGYYPARHIADMTCDDKSDIKLSQVSTTLPEDKS